MSASGDAHAGARRELPRSVAVAIATVLVAVAVVVVAQTSLRWRDAFAAAGRLPPGTAVAGTDIGGLTAGDARAVVARVAADALDRQVTITGGGAAWRLSPRALGATVDVDALAARVARDTAGASWPEVAVARLLPGAGFHFDVPVVVPAGAVEARVAGYARRLDQEPQDATVSWSGGRLEVHEHLGGYLLDRSAAVTGIRDALERGGADEVALRVERADASVTSEEVRAVLPAVRRAAEAALDRAVAVVHDGAAWRVSAREIGAVPDAAAALATVLMAREAAGTPGAAPAGAVAAASAPAPAGAAGAVPLDVPDDGLARFLDRVSESVDRPARDATLDYSTGWVEIRPGEPGVAVDRDAAAAALREAFRGGGGSITLPVSPVAPEVTGEAYTHVLLVRQRERRLYLYVGGEIAREWPVAVGTSGYATPTGIFTVGAKRYRPSWYNPAPNTWGASMPRVIGPGPANPLGVRALNWNRGGQDTMIRFHGTQNRASIGRAASHGCVRLTNQDVIELFDLVPSGATIVSLAG